MSLAICIARLWDDAGESPWRFVSRGCGTTPVRVPGDLYRAVVGRRLGAAVNGVRGFCLSPAQGGPHKFGSNSSTVRYLYKYIDSVAILTQDAFVVLLTEA